MLPIIPVYIHTVLNKLSVIISFLNEGLEVNNTLFSIRDTVGERVNIILINDASLLDTVLDRINGTKA